MKIAFIGQKGIPTKQGGIEKHVEELSQQLVKAGFDVTVYSRPHYTKSDKTNYHQVKIVNLPSINTKHLDAITHTFLATIHALFQNYDVIHYHGVGPALLAWLPRIFKPQTKVIATFHCIDRQHQKWNRFAKLILALGEWAACRFPHQTIVVSQVLAKYCWYRFDKETIYIPNGVKISLTPGQSQVLNKFNLKKNQYILTVSRLVKHKGIHTLIKAYQKIKTDKKLVIVGSGAKTNAYVEKIHALAAGNSNIVFIEQQSGKNLETLFKNAGLFVQPSEAEGLSITLLEAIAYGLPTIISNIEENQEIAKGFALEFKNKNANDLAQKLTLALKNLKNLKTKAAQAKKVINKKYHWPDIAKQIIQVYQEPIGAPLPLVKEKSYQF